AQYLPWNGALHCSYRFYADDWGIVAHSIQTELYQRVAPWLYLRANYRYHVQQGASFFAEHPSDRAVLRTSDSDLAALNAQTIGGMAALDLGGSKHFEVSYEHYFRSNDLDADIYSVAVSVAF